VVRGQWIISPYNGMRLMFLSVLETGSDCHVKSGVRTMHAVKGVGCVRFQLESGGSLEVAGVIYVPGMKLLSVSSLEDMGYAVMFEGGQVLIRSEGEDTQDATMRLGIREGMRDCTGCWDDLCWGPVDFWIQILCRRVGRLHERES
jgi:hypothetical protein